LSDLDALKDPCTVVQLPSFPKIAKDQTIFKFFKENGEIRRAVKKIEEW
jgi:hypothetical protein